MILVEVAHLALAALWLGAMAYSLAAVQPKIARYFTDERQREEFRTVLAHGNRWRVVGLVAALVLTAAAVAVAGGGTLAVGYGIAGVLYLAAGAIFANVSWRHWPARVFALPEELPGFQRRLRLQAAAMTVLVGAAYLSALTAALAA